MITPIQLIDTHCHLDLYQDPASVLAEIEHGGIYTIAVTNTPSVFSHCAALTQGKRFARTAIGLHPELAVARERELPLFIKLLPQTRYVGEVGLDYVTRDSIERAAQCRVFEKVLEHCAAAKDKILTVHSRRAAAEVLTMIGGGYPGTVILHWFSGSLTVLERAISLGCYFSINPAMFTSAAGRRIVATLPPERVLTETDGPFVTIAGQPARPPDIASVIVELAQLWGIDVDTTARQISDNLKCALVKG